MQLQFRNKLLPTQTSEILFSEMKDFYEESRCLGINYYDSKEFTEETANNLLKDFVYKQIEDSGYIQSSNGVIFGLEMSTG
jgi:hypothetical protein